MTRGMGITPRQRDLLEFVRANPDASYREIADGLGWATISHVGSRLKALQERGYIRWRANRARTIEIISPARIVYHKPGVLALTEINGERFVFIPFPPADEAREAA